MNDIKILGRLTADPELKYSNNGRGYAWFTVAVPRRSDKQQADFMHCVAFDKLAEALSGNCSKGRQILVAGRLEVSQKIDPQTQAKHVYHTIVADMIEFLQRPRPACSQPESPVADQSVATGA